MATEPHASTWGAFSAAAIGPLVGDYLVIVSCAMIGALWPLAAASTKSRKDGALLVLRLGLTAAALTSFIAYLIEANFNVPAGKVIGPVALLIGGFGDRWQSVFDLAGAVLARVLGGIGGGKQ